MRTLTSSFRYAQLEPLAGGGQEDRGALRDGVQFVWTELFAYTQDAGLVGAELTQDETASARIDDRADETKDIRRGHRRRSGRRR